MKLLEKTEERLGSYNIEGESDQERIESTIETLREVAEDLKKHANPHLLLIRIEDIVNR